MGDVMGPESNDVAGPGKTPQTEHFTEDVVIDPSILEPDVTFRLIPHSPPADGEPQLPTWRVRFDLASDPSVCFGLDINGEIILGRGVKEPNFVDLTPYGAMDAGVSREHLMIRPAVSNLYFIDMGSTNGTSRNERSIGVNTPVGVVDRDTIALGRLRFVVRVLKRPVGHTAALRTKADLADVLAQTAQAITSQLDLNAILHQVADAARSLTNAGEVGIWLVDEQSGELYLEAQWGIEDEAIQRLRLPVKGESPVSKVIKTGEMLRDTRKPGDEKIKVKTGYLVEALLYAPLKLGGITFGVLAAAHREPGEKFDSRDERVLAAIADFAAVAVQNARLYKATDDALAVRVKELAALNELTFSVSSSLDLRQVHSVLMEQINKHWRVDFASLWLVDEAKNSIAPFEEDGEARETLEIEEGTVKKVLESGKPLLYSGLEIDQKAGQVKKDDTAKIKMHSLACVPLRIQDTTVGALLLYAKRAKAFNETDLGRLQSFAQPVAIAITNARLFAETEHKQATVQATVNSLVQPLMILDDDGDLIVANKAANEVLEQHMSPIFEGISSSVGRTTEITVGDQTYITSSQHSPDVGTIIVMQDMTYVKKLESARAEFVQALTHDLKSPITSIKGWAYLLPKVSSLTDKGQQFITNIEGASNSVLEMLTQLLDVALLSETTQVERVPCDLIGEVNKAITSVQGAALAKSMNLTFEQKGKPYLINGEPMRLYRSVLNLLDNAVKYSPEQANIEVELVFTDDKITIRVQDDGPGIAESDLPYIFEQYFRGKREPGAQSGIGLGLSLVKSTIKAHGGLVSARNRDTGGAEFTITLPGSLRAGTRPLT